MLVKNLSTTTGEDCTLTYTNAGGAVTVELDIGDTFFTQDLTNANVTVTSDAGTPLIDIWVLGS